MNFISRYAHSFVILRDGTERIENQESRERIAALEKGNQGMKDEN
jgi:hypothetical protein